MQKTTVEAEFLYYTQKAGDVCRQVALTGIIVIWYFRYTEIGKCAIPGAFQVPTCLILISLIVDIVQYGVGSILWGCYLPEHNENDQNADTHPRINITLRIFIAVKLALMMVAFGWLTFAALRAIEWK